jgi:hypothetical protein
MKNKFTSSKLNSYIVDGAQKRNGMIRATKETASNAQSTNTLRGTFRIDTILSGTTGIGKSFLTELALAAAGINPVKISGQQTMFNFACNLMLEHYLFNSVERGPEERLIILIDDCDSFFKDKDSINILKGMTGKQGERVLQYNKAIQEHLMTPMMLSILDQYRHSSGAMGFSVNCDNIVFIMTTNFNLPTENYANGYLAKNGPTPRANRLMDLAAIRRRFTTKDFVLDKNTNWGWLAHVTLTDNLVDFLGKGSKAFGMKRYLLEWMYHNWEAMHEHNLDTVTDLAYKMLEYPDDYNDIWEADYIGANVSDI